MQVKNKKREIVNVIIILIIQTIVFIVAGINKSYIHMDEAYSLGLASYYRTDIQENDDFYNTWHNKEYYSDYLTVNENEKNDFSQVYENQKNDVHPPLYYLLLRIAMGFHIDSYSKWPGIILNIIIYAFITIFMYLIINKLLQGNDRYKENSAMLALVSSLTLSSINNVIYIRMYALSTLNIAITTYLHLKLLDKEENNYKLLLAIGIFALIGSLTHYYYLFYLAMLFVMFVIKYLKEKKYKELGKYVGIIALAGIISLIIFPYSIQHMFFGYRGQGVISNLTDISKFIISICAYIFITNVYAFNNTLFILLIFIVGMIIYKKVRKIKIVETKNKYVKYLMLPTFFYAILVAIASPFIELRYVMPVCNLIFVLFLYLVITLLKNISKEKILNKIIIGVYLLILIMPFISNKIIELSIGEDFRNEQESSYSSKTAIAQKLRIKTSLPIEVVSDFTDISMDDILLYIKDFKLEPEVMYSNKRNISKMIRDNSNLPTLYILDSNHNRFLDDILLFTNITESYIAKDMKCNEEKIKEVFLNKDTSQGILIFINDGQRNDDILDVIKNGLDLKNIKYLDRLNACDVYLVN